MTTWVQVQLRHIDCYKCHVVFGMTVEHDDLCRKRGGEFYCPNGHSQHYTETEIQRLEKSLTVANKQRDIALLDRNRWRTNHEQKARSLAATKGVVTKIKRRVGKGVCPCCNRNFKDLRTHMEGQHPDWSEGQ